MELDLKELEARGIAALRYLSSPSSGVYNVLARENVTFLYFNFPRLIELARAAETANARIAELERERDAWKLAAKSKSSVLTKEEMDAQARRGPELRLHGRRMSEVTSVDLGDLELRIDQLEALTRVVSPCGDGSIHFSWAMPSGCRVTIERKGTRTICRLRTAAGTVG